ncbi:hypothetical protein G1K37_11310 [Tenacibaculum dicentrarchi]|nr:hypothetical protein [Tenacibaculum dicentrarchi]
MEKYKEFKTEDRQKVIDTIKSIENNKVLIKMNNIRFGNSAVFRVSVENITTDKTQSNLFFKELLDKLS